MSDQPRAGVCERCSAIVADDDVHDDWHAELDRRFALLADVISQEEGSSVLNVLEILDVRTRRRA